MNKYTFPFALILPLLIAGCHSNDDDNDSNEQVTETVSGVSTEATNDGDNQLAGDEISVIAGLWDYSEIDPRNGEADIVYLLVESDSSSDNAGLFTVADYDQDEDGSGENCYYTTSLPLTPLGSNQYRLGLPASDPFQERIMTIVKNDDVLTISYLDRDDQNSNGETSDTFTNDHAEITGIDTAFVECESE